MDLLINSDSIKDVCEILEDLDGESFVLQASPRAFIISVTPEDAEIVQPLFDEFGYTVNIC